MKIAAKRKKLSSKSNEYINDSYEKAFKTGKK